MKLGVFVKYFRKGRIRGVYDGTNFSPLEDGCLWHVITIEFAQTCSTSLASSRPPIMERDAVKDSAFLGADIRSGQTDQLSAVIGDRPGVGDCD